MYSPQRTLRHERRHHLCRNHLTCEIRLHCFFRTYESHQVGLLLLFVVVFECVVKVQRLLDTSITASQRI